MQQAMTEEIHACGPEESIVEVAQRMIDSRQRRNAVIEGGKLVGQVSSSNVLWALMEHSREARALTEGCGSTATRKDSLLLGCQLHSRRITSGLLCCR